MSSQRCFWLLQQQRHAPLPRLCEPLLGKTAAQAAASSPIAMILAKTGVVVKVLASIICFQYRSGWMHHVAQDREHPLQAAPSVAPQKTNFPGVPVGKPLGIITIEDVIEELLQQV